MRLLRLDIRTYIFLYGHRFLYKVLLASDGDIGDLDYGIL